MAKLPFALQLYSVRGPLETDLNATLQRVKTIGYDHVETAGLHGHSAAQFAASLADAGLNVVVWTVNDPAEARRVRDLGAVGLCTDDPAGIRGALA